MVKSLINKFELWLLNLISRRFNILLHDSGKKANLILIFKLLWYGLLAIKLKIYKFFKGINYPIIHYYAVCWNEEKILPFILDYYNKIVDKFIFYDNQSTDNTVKILSTKKNIEIINYTSSDTINDDVYIQIKNNCWKVSRGKADYVIVCDVDEILYHPDIDNLLKTALEKRLSFFYPNGYDMYSKNFPIYNSSVVITDLIKSGIRSEKYSKCLMFDPLKIIEIRYSHGAHSASPLGIIKAESISDLKMLHFKNLGIDYVLEKVRSYRTRLSEFNLQHSYGKEYLDEEKKLKEDFINNFTKSDNII